MKNKRVLLLGGTGFIGSALADRLRKDHVPLVTLGSSDTGYLQSVLPTCSTVIHLASATTPGSSFRLPGLEQINLRLTRHLVDCLKAQPQTRLIYFSSGGAVYGNPEQLPVSEDCPLAPLSPYGLAKVEQEIICRQLRSAGSFVTILRPSNAYGPGQKFRDGFGLIRTVLEHARMGTTLEIWGDGESVRDFIYIDDIVDATIQLMHIPSDNGTYNLGSGRGHSVNQVKGLVESVCGEQVRSICRPSRVVDVRDVVLDISRLSNRLNWKPTVGLAQGAAHTLDWLNYSLPQSGVVRRGI